VLGELGHRGVEDPAGHVVKAKFVVFGRQDFTAVRAAATGGAVVVTQEGRNVEFTFPRLFAVVDGFLTDANQQAAIRGTSAVAS
jgi:hypothetical protein